jgi:hypothetical protein
VLDGDTAEASGESAAVLDGDEVCDDEVCGDEVCDGYSALLCQ